MVRTKFLNRIFLAVSILACPFMYGMQQESAALSAKTIAFSFDLDDVISGKEKVGFNDFLPLTGMFFWNPKLMTAALPANQEAIQKHVKEMEDNGVNGSTNIIRGVSKYLKNNGYGDISSYEADMNKITQKPSPVLRMIANITKLKDLGYSIFGATNMDCEQLALYGEHMKSAHNINLKKLFNGIVTTSVYHREQPAGDELVYHAGDNVYVLRKKEHVKPNPDYFHGVRQVIQSFNPDVEEIIHTDDRKENTEGAQLAEFKALHFNLPEGSVRRSTPEQIEKTIDTWEQAINKFLGRDIFERGN